MKRLCVIIAISALGISAMAPAQADPKPKNAKTTDAQTLANLYGGKTQNWKSSGGGIYYGPNWEAQAFSGNHPKNAGIGKWSVDGKGRVCHQLVWYWPNGDEVGSKEDDPECITHVTDPDGIIWRSWPGDKEWWKATGSQSLEKGFKFKSKIRRNRKKMKL